jgi:PhzF family phenazine biosynthesis protein
VARVAIYQVDAFTSQVFSGNPAAVCPLEEWLQDDVMQAIAAENNLSETAFFVKEDDRYRIRWFTPVDEVDLCGHATLATAYVIFEYLDKKVDEIHFVSKSGPLSVRKKDGLITLDFPSKPPVGCSAPAELIRGLGSKPQEILCADDYFVLYASEDDIKAITPDMEVLKRLELRGVIVTAPGKSVDFVSRFFAPRLGVDEDPVTGSAHCTLIPYWSKRLNKNRLNARQLSSRGGELHCEDRGDRVLISGRAIEYMKGEITAIIE